MCVYIYIYTYSLYNNCTIKIFESLGARPEPPEATPRDRPEAKHHARYVEIVVQLQQPRALFSSRIQSVVCSVAVLGSNYRSHCHPKLCYCTPRAKTAIALL